MEIKTAITSYEEISAEHTSGLVAKTIGLPHSPSGVRSPRRVCSLLSCGIPPWVAKNEYWSNQGSTEKGVCLRCAERPAGTVSGMS
ncbi:hypothetical protein Ddc_17750 [Ditylenchus destructor]|nr:hypothetical protein Ddc_17750 [Ditylenchus destructor]